MALPSATNIYSGAQPFPTLTPGAGLWLISHQLAVNTGASTLTFTVTVGGRTVYGNGIGYYKAAGITSVDFPIQVLAAAAEDIIVSVLSTNSSDTAVTSNTPSAVLQSVNTTQVDGTAVGLATEFDANVVQISGDSTAADNLEAAFDGTGYAGGAIKQKVDLDTIKTQAVTCAAGVTVRADVGAAAAPGAANGMLIGGSNAATTFVSIDCTNAFTLAQLRVNSSNAGGAIDVDNSNGPAMRLSGTDYGLYAEATEAAGVGIYGYSGGIAARGAVFSADGAGGVDMVADITGNITGNLSGSVGSIGAGGIANTSFAAGAIDADAIANDAIDNATFAADVGSTAYATNIIALAVNKALGNYDAPTDTEMTAAFTEIKGATWAAGTDTLEHIRNKQTDIEADLVVIKAKTNTIAAGTITVTSPVSSDQTVSIVQYDDYLTATSRPLSWTNTSGDWFDSDITSATVTFTAKTKGGVAVLEKAGAVVTATGTQEVTVDLTSAETALFTLEGKQYEYQLLLTKATYREVEVTGDLSVTLSLSPPA